MERMKIISLVLFYAGLGVKELQDAFSFAPGLTLAFMRLLNVGCLFLDNNTLSGAGSASRTALVPDFITAKS